MAQRFITLVVALAAALTWPATTSRAQAGANLNARIAFTFSDAPSSDEHLFSGAEHTKRVLEALKPGTSRKRPSILTRPILRDPMEWNA
jgi:hypothetical protein